MAFKDTFKDTGGSKYIDADEKQALAEGGVEFAITSVIEDEDNKYGPRYVLKAIVPNPETGDDEERAIGFQIGTVESRDRMLKQMEEYLDGDDAEDVLVTLEKVGRSWILRLV